MQKNPDQWLADEIHDGPLQLLTAARMLMESIDLSEDSTSALRSDQADGNKDAATIDVSCELVKSLKGLVDDASTQLREMIDQLDPSYLQSYGLVAAIQQLADRFYAGVTIKCQADSASDDIDERVAIELYRIVQSAIGNSVRHSQADAIEVILQVIDEELVLKIIDNGVGVEAEIEGEDAGDNMGQPRANGRGLASIARRVERLGGSWSLRNRSFEFEVDSDAKRGRGAQIEVRLPRN